MILPSIAMATASRKGTRRTPMTSVPSGCRSPGYETRGEKPHCVLVGDRVGEVRLPELPPVPGFQACLLPQLALGRTQGFLALRAAAFRYLPRVAFKGIAVLPDEVDVILLHRQDADGGVLVVDDAVDARLAVRPYRRCPRGPRSRGSRRRSSN